MPSPECGHKWRYLRTVSLTVRYPDEPRQEREVEIFYCTRDPWHQQYVPQLGAKEIWDAATSDESESIATAAGAWLKEGDHAQS